MNKKILNFEEYIKKSSNNYVGKDLKSKNVIIGEIILDKQKLSQAQSNSLSRSTDKTEKK